MAFPYRLLVSSFVLSSVTAVVVACSANGAGEGILTEGEGATEPPAPTSKTVLPPSNKSDAAPDDASVMDAGKDAAKDAAKDAGFDAGKPAPNPGDACPVIDEIIKRTCGMCGFQEAVCLPTTDGTPGGIVTEYSACSNEIVGGCMPGITETEACGNCGTRMRTCTQYCAWNAGACAGEPVNACPPTAQDYTTAGCPTPGTVRTRACSGTCTWSNFTATCGSVEFQLVASGTAGSSVSAIYPLRAALMDKRIAGTCPNGYFSTTTKHPYAYVEIVNPSAETLKLSAWNTLASSSDPIIDTVMTWYPGSEKPVGDAARKACGSGVGDSCPSTLPCGDYKWAGLTGTNAITLPPFGSAFVWFASYYATGSGSPAEGNVKLVLRTDSAL